MKKTLVALAALAVVGAASAQSAVSITGTIGAAYQSADGTFGNTANNIPPTSNAYRGLTLTNADFKLTAMEDLGGGLKAVASASFETPTTASTSVNPLTGVAAASTKNGSFDQGVVRRTTSVALAGTFGTVSFTNSRSGNLLTNGMVAPANLQEGIYDNSGIITRMPVDVLTYLTAPTNGLQGLVQWIDAANDGNGTPAINVLVLGANYSQGPLAAGVQYKIHYLPEISAAGAALGGYARKNRLEAFATYDLGSAKIGFGYDGGNIGTVDNALAFGGGAAGQAAVDTNAASAYSLGVAVPVGAITLGANWAKRDVNNLYELVAKYDLSKRTNVNASLGRHSTDRVDDATGSVLNGQQYRVGIYHNF